MDLFSAEDQERIADAIQLAENQTSGEIRICVSQHCKGDILKQAKIYFEKLGMHKTALKNGVLIYLAVEDHKFAIIGDKGINQKVPVDFWETTRNILQDHFRKGQFVEGLIKGISSAGEQLHIFFPKADDDVNELPNEMVQF